MRLIRNLGFVVSTLVFLSIFGSCIDTRKSVYFNNISDTLLNDNISIPEPLIQKSDLLNITVSSLNPDASVIFNTPNLIAGMSISSSALNGSPNSVGTPQFTGYLVNTEGNINFPVLGSISAEGLSKKQLEQKIADSLVSKKLLTDPIISIRFLNFRVTVLGEVARPTTINVTNERISILEALGLAGDLTVYGKRDNVLLIRENKNEKIVRRIDLNSSLTLSSPYYYLKSNDVLYVEARKEKVLSTSRTQQLLPILISALSFAAIIASYYLKK